MMKKVLALALVGLMASTASAAWMSIVALDGPNAWTGGEPSATNGAIGVNFLGVGATPQAGGPGIVIAGPSATARIGVVVECVAASPTSNIDTVNLFFTGLTGGGGTPTPGAANIAAVQDSATNALGHIWERFQYPNGTSMKDWADGGFTPYGPVVEEYNVNASDQIGGVEGEGGNFAGQANETFLLQDVTIHGVLGADDGSVYTLLGFDTGATEVFASGPDVNTGTGVLEHHQYVYTDVGLEPALGHSGFWYARNGRAAKTAFPVVVLPEPGALSLLALGGLALIRRRK